MSAIQRLIDRKAGAPRVLRVLGASGQLGYGIPAETLRKGLQWTPDFIGCDMGSIDPGPAYLGSGQMATTPALAKRDLKLVLTGARTLDVPLIIGTAGTAGAAPHLQRTLDLVREIAFEERLSFRLATIAADIPPEDILRAKHEGRLSALGPGLEPDDNKIAGSSYIVGQMGTEAITRALDTDADVVIAGRACDTAIFTAIPRMLGYDTAIAMQMAKIIECTSICCTPGGRDPIMATLSRDHFLLESAHPERKATPLSVAAHSLYEQTDPDELIEPEGKLRLHSATYTPVDERRLSVSGAIWEPATEFSVKVEGAIRVGERSVLLAGSADPDFISQIDRIVSDVEATTRGMVTGPFSLHIRRYGLDALVPRDADRPTPPEIFILAEAIADDHETAETAISVFKQHLLHHGFPGRLCTAGNLAFPFTPPELEAGTAWRFSVYHQMAVSALAPLFPVSTEEL